MLCMLSNWHSLNANYYGTTFDGVPGSFNSDQIECMCSQNRPRFRFPSKRLSIEAQIPCLKGSATPKSRSCFCLHLRPKDDVVISILIQGKSFFGSKMLHCLHVSRAMFLKWGVSAQTSGGWLPETCKEHGFFYPNSDFPCTRIKTTTKQRPIFVWT